MAGKYSEEQFHADVVSFIANAKVNPTLAEELAKKIAEEVTNKSVELISIVIILRDYLTSDEDVTRQKALSCLSTILENISPSALKKNDISVIFDFYHSKMDDSGCMKETLQGFTSLATMDCFYVSNLESLLKVLANEYQPTNFLAGTRYFGFKIMENLLKKFNKHLLANKKLNDLYIDTFILIATGEKDPRNLLISFSLNSRISTQLIDIDKYKEELFDILFCYFPIMFKPPSNDPYKITNQDLKLALRAAISATEKFEDDAFGNLVDKLTASSPSVKNDTILTIKACLDSFSSTSCLKHWLPIWQALKFEIMNNNDPEPNNAILSELSSNLDPQSSESSFSNYADSLSVITTISAKLISFEESAFDKFLSHVFEEFIPNFEQGKDLKQSCDILSSMANVNLITLDKVLKKILPLFFNEKLLDVSQQKLLLLNLTPFFNAYIKIFGETGREVSKFKAKTEFLKYKDDILMVLSKALTGTSKNEVTLRTLSIVQFTTLVKMSGFLELEEISMIVQYLTETILTDVDRNIYYACLEGLKFISVYYENVVYEVSLKTLLDLLPTDSANDILLNETESVPMERILKVILDFTTSRHHLVKESIMEITNKLSVVGKNPDCKDYCFLLISTLYSLFQNNFDEFDDKTLTFLKTSIEPNFLETILAYDIIYMDDHSLTLASDVLFYLNIKTDIANHQSVLNKYNDNFLGENKIFEHPKRSIVTYSRILASLDKEIMFEDAKEILFNAVDLLKKNKNLSEFERLNYLEFLSLLSNKWVTEDNVKQMLDFNDLSMANLNVMFWLTKGLVMKNSALALECTNFLLKLLSDIELGNSVACFFEILVLDLPIFRRFKKISWNNNVRLLYKQKFFSDVANKLVNAFKATDNMTLKSNYLTALSLVLKNTSTTITMAYISELLPLLLQALDLNNVDVKISALQTLKDTCEQLPQLITEHVHSLIPLLLDMIKASKYNTISVRSLSLEILNSLSTNVPLNYLLPFKNEIVTKLQVGLDDKKRKIRKQSIDTKQAFLELGQVPFE